MLHILDTLKQAFASCKKPEETYRVIMELGQALPPFPDAHKTDDNRVAGCQSTLYLHTELRGGQLYFSAFSDALISAGLAALLIDFYSGMTAEEILKTPPSFLEELGIPLSLSPTRANGLASLTLRIKQEALKALTHKE